MAIGRRATVFLVIAAFAAGGCQSSARPQAGADKSVSITVGGVQRTYFVHSPAHAGSGKLPAVLVFHGGGGTPEELIAKVGFDQEADAHGFLAVYPAGYERSWNDGRGGDTKAGRAGIDDVAFVSAVIDKIEAEDGADPHRVFATGISNGAMFTEQLGCRLGARLAAIAPVAGPLPVADQAACAPPHPLSVLEIHGTDDPIVPYGGGPVAVTSGHLGGEGTSPVLSVAATQEVWRGKDGCTGSPVASALPDTAHDGTSVTVQTSAACLGGSSVVLYTVHGGGHTWPDGTQYLPRLIVGQVSHQFNATDVIWRFFQAAAPR